MKRAISLLVFLVGCATAAPKPDQVSSKDAVRLRLELARSFVAYGEWVAASQPLLELEQLTPSDAEVHALLGDVYRGEGLPGPAEREYQLAISLEPRCAHALGGLGVLRSLRGPKDEGALALLREAIELEPRNPVHRNNLGFALYARGDYAAAIDSFNEALRFDPASSSIRTNLGFAYAQQGKLDRARREFERAGGPAAADNNLGLLQELAGDYASACTSYRDAIAKDGRLKVAFINAERACARRVVP